MNQESLNASRKINDYLGFTGPNSNIMSIQENQASIESNQRNNLTSLDTTKNISEYNIQHQISQSNPVEHQHEHQERIQFINNKLQGLQNTKLEIRNRVQKKLREDIKKINISSGFASGQAVSHASLTKVRSSQDQEFNTFGLNTGQRIIGSRVDTTGSPDKDLNYNYDPLKNCKGLFPISTTSQLSSMKAPMSIAQSGVQRDSSGNYSTVSLQNQNMFLNVATVSTTSPTSNAHAQQYNQLHGLAGHSVSDTVSGQNIQLREQGTYQLNPQSVSNSYSGIGTIRGALQPMSMSSNSGIGTIRGALQPMTMSSKERSTSNSYSGVDLGGTTSFSPKSILTNGRNSNQLNSNQLQSKRLSYRQTDYNLPLQYNPKSRQTKEPTPIKEASQEAFTSRQSSDINDIVSSPELDTSHDFSMNIELFNKRLARIGNMKTKLQKQQEKLFESNYARELAEKLKDASYQEVFKIKVANDQKVDEKFKVKQQFEEFILAQQQYIEEQKLLNQQFPKQSELNNFQMTQGQECLQLAQMPINIASGSTMMSTNPTGMVYLSPQMGMVMQNSQKLEPKITGQSEASPALFLQQQNSSGMIMNNQGQLIHPNQAIQPQPLVPVFYNPQTGQIIQNPQHPIQNLNPAAVNQCIQPNGLSTLGTQSMQNTSHFNVLSEQNIPQGPFSMENTLSVNHQQEEIDAYEQEYQEQMREIEDQILILTHNSQTLQQNKLAAQQQVHQKYAQMAGTMSSGGYQQQPMSCYSNDEQNYEDNDRDNNHVRSQSMQVQNTHIKEENNMDYMNQSYDLPQQIHQVSQVSSAPQHKRCKTENNNVYKRKRESRNDHDKIQKVLPVKLLKNKKGANTQNEEKTQEQQHKRRLTQMEESPKYFFINQTTYQTMLSTPNGTINDGSQTRRQYKRQRNEAPNSHMLSGPAPGLADTINSINRRETTYEGEESPKTQILIQTLKNVEKQLENIQIAQNEQNQMNLSQNQMNNSSQIYNENNQSFQTQQFQPISRPQTEEPRKLTDTEHLNEEIHMNFLECQRSLSQIEIMKSQKKVQQRSRSRSRGSISPSNSRKIISGGRNSQSKQYSSIKQSPVNYEQFMDQQREVLSIQDHQNSKHSGIMHIQEETNPLMFSQDSSQIQNFISQNIVQDGNMSQEFYVPNDQQYTIDQSQDNSAIYDGNQRSSVRQSYDHSLTSEAVSPQKIEQHQNLQYQIDPDDFQNDSTVEAQQFRTRDDLTITLGQHTIVDESTIQHKKCLVASAAGETTSEALTDQESANIIQYVPINNNQEIEVCEQEPNYYIDFVQEQNNKLLKSDPHLVNQLNNMNEHSSNSKSDLQSQISQRMLSQDQLYYKLIQQTHPDNWKKLNTYCSTHRGRQSDNVLSLGTQLRSGGSIPDLKKASHIATPCPEMPLEAEATEIYQSYGTNNLPINLNSHSSKSLGIHAGFGSSMPPISNNRMGILSSNSKSNMTSQKSFEYKMMMHPDPVQHSSLSPTNMMQFGFYNGTFDQEALPKEMFNQTYNKDSDGEQKIKVEQTKSNMMSLQPPEISDNLTTEIDRTKRIESKQSMYSRPTSKTKRRPPIPKISQIPKGSFQSSVHTTQRCNHSANRHQKSRSTMRSGKYSETELAHSNRALIQEIRDQNEQVRRSSLKRNASGNSRQALQQHQTQQTILGKY